MDVLLDFWLSNKFLEFNQNFTVNSYINSGLFIFIVCKQVRMPGKEEFQTVSMAIFRAEMAWSVPIDIFGIDISSKFD